jgi:hypothetical protein
LGKCEKKARKVMMKVNLAKKCTINAKIRKTLRQKGSVRSKNKNIPDHWVRGGGGLFDKDNGPKKKVPVGHR